MKQRCLNPRRKDFVNYGAKNITVCEEWMEFANFLKWASETGYDDSKTLDRVDVCSGYEPNNCRWVDMKTQQNNRGNNKLISFGGQTHTRQQWAEITGIKYTTIRNRLDVLGWPEEKALTTQAKGVM